jgi:RNA polymerase sigma-70 factor (ECF subfamily)
MSTNTEQAEPDETESRRSTAAAASETSALAETPAPAADDTVSAENDARLLEATRRGDHAAFESFVRRHERIISGYLRARLTGGADVDDLTQEVFLRVYVGKAVQKDGSRSDLRAWLLGVARNVLREHVRKTRRRRETAWTELCLEIEELAASEGNFGHYDEAIARLPDCLQGLGPSARQSLDMYYHADLSMREIAERFKRSEGAVKLLVHRARQAVKRCLDGATGGGVA